MTALSFFVPGRPKGKMRPHPTARFGRAVMYDDKTQVSAENWVKVCADLAGCIRKDDLLTGPLIMSIVIWVTPPKGTREFARQCEAGLIRPTKKPDVDNVLKLVADSLNKLVYKDDAQFVEMHGYRRYTCAVHPAEGVDVRIKDWTPTVDTGPTTNRLTVPSHLG